MSFLTSEQVLADGENYHTTSQKWSLGKRSLEDSETVLEPVSEAEDTISNSVPEEELENNTPANPSQGAGGKVITDKVELESQLSMISKKDLGGRWKIKNQADREKISKHLKNINGVAKTRLEYYKESSKFPMLKIVNIMHDGEFRDQVVYQKISIREPVFKKQGEDITVYYEKATVEVSYGRLYSIAQDHNCVIDVNATFKILEDHHINSTILLTSDGA
jgi:hypothetical protein